MKTMWCTLAAVLLFASFAFADERSGVTRRVSVDSAGGEANNESAFASITKGGRLVAFASIADNLVPNDTNGAADTFVRDTLTGRTERVSVSSLEEQGNADSGFVGARGIPAISADGRFVAFPSDASNLVVGDTNNLTDIFVRDRLTGKTERVSLRNSGAQSNGLADGPAISADGRFVAFQSDDMALVPIDTPILFQTQVYVRDRKNDTTERISVNSDGELVNSDSGLAAISADGRFVSFSSFADNVVRGENFSLQVYLRDRARHVTELVSGDRAGRPGNGNSALAVVSGDGRFVAFESNADNLVRNGNHENHVYLRDRRTGRMERISEDEDGRPADLLSGEPDISDDGRFVAFYSLATNLVRKDNNNRRDIFVRDREENKLTRVSVSSDGEEGDSESFTPKISNDGSVVAFQSNASNLVRRDNNSAGDVFVNTRRNDNHD